jgi:hypothetical protein
VLSFVTNPAVSRSSRSSTRSTTRHTTRSLGRRVRNSIWSMRAQSPRSQRHPRAHQMEYGELQAISPDPSARGRSRENLYPRKNIKRRSRASRPFWPPAGSAAMWACSSRWIIRRGGATRYEPRALNEDGSADLYFGPNLPKEGYEQNWVRFSSSL